MFENNDSQALDVLMLEKKEAFSNLYDRYASLMFGYISTIVKEKEAGEQILQRVFIKMWDEFNSREDFTEKWFGKMLRMANEHIPETELKLQWLQDCKTFRK